MNTQEGLLAKKLGMTQFFTTDGTRVPVTVLQVAGNTVTAHRTAEKDGYTALQIGFDEQKPSRMSKPELGQYKSSGVAPRKVCREFRVPADALAKYPVGSDLPIELFAEGEFVDVVGTTRGKGFAGVMKRHNMSGKPGSHGVHEYFRHGGSIGCRLTPGRVLPGKRMGGQMGNVRMTAENLRIARVMAEDGLILVRGPVPGARGCYVTIRRANKLAIRKAAGQKR